MSTLECGIVKRSVLLAGLALAFMAPAQAQVYGLGKPVTAAQIQPWDIDVRPDGQGLPPGRGSVAQGKALFEGKCAACHGMKGEGTKIGERLTGGEGTLKSATPRKSIGSFWPYATTVFDYVRRAMPYDRPQSLTPDELYAVTGYLLHLNGILPADASLDAASLPKVQMPNRNGFTTDPRPDTATIPCRQDCK